MEALKKILPVQFPKSKWIMYPALLLSCCFLLLSAQLYIDANNVLSHAQQKNDGFEYLVVNKTITNSMMGDNTHSFFTPNEISETAKQNAIHKIGLITSNKYGISASTLGRLAFSTQLFFESVPDEFLDIIPTDWHWQMENKSVPIILSADYLNLYNFGFALSQGLPQMSEETIKAIPFNVTIYDQKHEAQFVAHVVGFTQRYSSVLVPIEFMQYANTEFGADKQATTARMILKTKEPDQPQLVTFLHDHGYATQNEKLKNSKLKSIVNMVFTVCGFIGLFVFALSGMLVWMYVKLRIIESAGKLQLLILLGYKPIILQHQFTNKTARVFLVFVLFALVCVAFVQWLLSVHAEKVTISLSPMISWKTIVIAFSTAILMYFILKHKVKKVIDEVL